VAAGAIAYAATASGHAAELEIAMRTGKWAAIAAVVLASTLAACSPKKEAPAAPEAPLDPGMHVATAGPDVIKGTDGIDTVTYAGAPAQIYLVFGDLGHSSGWAQGDTFENIENLIGTDHGDSLAFGDGANTVDAGAGNDIIFGQAGDDLLIGGLGADAYMYTGPGFGHDTIQEFEWGDVLNFEQYPGMTFAKLKLEAKPEGVLVTVGDDSILLGNVTLDKVDASRFNFAK
jgi:Ca2+-binding RTX toxin-like protein